MLRATLLEAAGLYRDAAGLRAGRDALDTLDARIRRGLETRDAKEAVRALEAANMVAVGRFIVLFALAREESRGAHQRTDFPAMDDDRWKHHAAVLPGNGSAVGAVGLR